MIIHGYMHNVPLPVIARSAWPTAFSFIPLLSAILQDYPPLHVMHHFQVASYRGCTDSRFYNY